MCVQGGREKVVHYQQVVLALPLSLSIDRNINLW